MIAPIRHSGFDSVASLQPHLHLFNLWRPQSTPSELACISNPTPLESITTCPIWLTRPCQRHFVYEVELVVLTSSYVFVTFRTRVDLLLLNTPADWTLSLHCDHIRTYRPRLSLFELARILNPHVVSASNDAFNLAPADVSFHGCFDLCNDASSRHVCGACEVSTHVPFRLGS